METLDTGLIVAIAASLIAWGLVSAKFQALNVSAPIAFVVLGLVLANDPVSAIDVDVHGETLRSLAEVTLALLLFSDAARVNLRVLRHDAGVELRLLLVGLPLTIALGTALAVVLFPDLDPWAAAVIAAAVAPTDAALGAQVVEDEHVPARIRRILNVESGLNDGIATPFVTFFIAGTVADTMKHSSTTLGGSLGDLGIGVLVGVAVGLGGGFLLVLSTRRGLASPTYRGVGVLALALLAFALSIELGGNGFIGAFVGGLAFGTMAQGSHAATGDTRLRLPERQAPLPRRLVPLRRGDGDGTRGRDVADRGLCDPRPHRGAHGSGGDRHDRRRAHPHDGRVHGLVRPARPGIRRVRRDRVRLAERIGSRPRCSRRSP